MPIGTYTPPLAKSLQVFLYPGVPGLIPVFMLTIEEQFIQVMSNPKIYRSVSKAMYLILNRRHNVMTK